ncbi:MAG: HlyD family efflux transporter periplasmic adaptor subunit, partial [Alphaproteobacteria bacterium]|nr:HlyD family efflux transporter periplasmic adaptor subunit [Alphaproteobacteria bacterium]
LERSSQLLEKTSVLAPYDGIVEKVFVDVGDVVASGAPCARVIDMDPLIISGKVTEDEVVKLRTGVSGWAILPGGLRLDGILRYIAHSADEKTKTYRVELETNDANTNNPAVRAGITAQIHIPLRAVRAHSIPSSILTLNEQGKVGLRLVQKINNKNIVQFTEIEIIEGNADTYWVKGLPEKVELIVVGQEYVQHGTEVAIDRTKAKP